MIREQALGKYIVLKKQIYELGIKSQALVKDIQEETETFLSDKDFSTMDFKKIETLAVELQQLQVEYKEKVSTFLELKETYNITE